MSTEVMRQVRNALVWNLNTDLDNIPACEKWADMLRKNIDDLDKAIADAELKWVGLTYEEESDLIRLAHNHAGIRFYIQAAEAKLKEKNNG
jgi:hypothetical protein